MLNYHSVIHPTITDSFFDQSVDLWLGLSSGHMGPHMYQHHNGMRGGQSMSGITTWNEHAQNGSIPKQSRAAFISNIHKISAYTGQNLPIVEFGPGSMEDAKLILHFLKSKEYIPVDFDLEIIKRSRSFASNLRFCSVMPAVVDFFSDNTCPLIDKPALAVLLGLTINNIAGAVPQAEPRHELIRSLKNLTKAMPAGGYLLISTDVCQDGEQNKNRYNEPWHKDFGVNHLFRMEAEIPMFGFDPNGFEYCPIWHDHCSLIAHTVRATRNQVFEMGSDAAVTVSVKRGDTFHYNNSFKYRPEFFEECAKAANLEIIRRWKGHHSMSLYLFYVPSQKTSNVTYLPRASA